MKLIKCYVFSFGKLKDLTIDFNGELNIFKEDNGWGKSTLASFIKAIFYGLADTKKSVAENERIKYKTWNSTQKFGGYIEFEWGGKHYKLERYFGNKQSEDSVSLIDLATGKSFSNTENLGARIFQIDEEGFLSTTYFSQKDFQAKSNTSITAKFNSVCEIQDSDAFDKAVSKLEEKAKLYKKTGDKGLIADTKREIFSVNEEIQRINIASKTVDSLKQGVSELEEEVESLKKKTALLTQRVSEAGKVEAVSIKKDQYQAYLAKKQQYEAKKAELELVLKGERPTEQELNVCFDCCRELSKVSEREKVLAEDLKELNNYEYKQNQELKPNLTYFIFFALSFIFICAGVGLLFTELLWLSITFFMFALACGFAIILKRFFFNKKDRLSDNSNIKFIEQKLKDYEDYKSIRQNYEQNINEFLSRFGGQKSDYFSALSNISTSVKNINLIDKELLEINAKVCELEKDNSILDNSQKSLDFTSLKQQLGQAQEAYSKKATELAKKQADIKYYQDQADRLSELEDKKRELSEKQEQYKQEYDIILKTLEFLNKADENLKIKYRAPLESSLNKYLSLISGADRTALIDIDLNVTIEEVGGAKQTDFYSKGEQNLFEICKRFALTDVLFTGEKPFIILDDPFYNLDDGKLKQALELVKKLSYEYQIIYFVCHESRKGDHEKA